MWVSYNSHFMNNQASTNGGVFYLDQAKIYMGNLPPVMDSLPMTRAVRTAPLGGAGCTVETCNFPAPLVTATYPGPKAAGNTAPLGCNFFNNSAMNGASIDLSAQAYARVEHAVFRQNMASEYGAAVSVRPSGISELVDLTCYENSAGVAGGCVFWWDKVPTDNSWSCTGSTKENRCCEGCTMKHNTAQYGPDLATDANFMEAVYSRQWGGVTPGSMADELDDVVGKPLGSTDPSRSRRQIYSQTSKSMNGVGTVDDSVLVYRPGIRFNMFFLGYDYFGSILQAKQVSSGPLITLPTFVTSCLLQNGNDLLAKVAPCTGPECSPDTRNIGRYMLEFSGVISKADAPGAAQIVPLMYGGKEEVNYTWALDYNWIRPDLSPGVMKKVQVSATITAYTQPCAVGERVVFDESPLNVMEVENHPDFTPGDWDDAIAECVWCPAGTYSTTKGTTTCKNCPTKGALCTGGGSYIIPKKNYWRGYPGDHIYKCPYTDSCLQGTGVQGTQCEYGYNSTLCAVCQTGFVSSGSKCIDCGKTTLSADMLSLILLITICCAMIVHVALGKWFGAPPLKGAKALKELMKKKKNMARTNAIMAQGKILVAYLQITMSIVNTGAVDYPSAFTNFMSLVSFLNLDILALFRGVCVGPDGGFTYYDLLTFNVFFPVGLAILMFIWYSMTKPDSDDDSFEARTHGGTQCTIVLVVIFCVFPSTCSYVTNYWRCHEIQVNEFETKHYLFAAYDQECFEGDWLAYLPVGIIGTFLYPIGTPLLFFGVLYKQFRAGCESDLYTDETVLAKYGFLYNRFKPEFWWYETSEVIRKMMMGSVIQFIMPNGKSGTASQMLIATVINVSYTVLFLGLWPFKGIDDNMLMALTMVAISVTTLCALALNGEISVVDGWHEETTTGVLLGMNATLLFMYFAMMYHYQLPFICKHLTPSFIANSSFNCYKNKGPNQADGKAECLMKTIFTNADTDGNGTLDPQEFVQALKSTELGFSNAEIDSIMDQVDENGDGVIEYAEFVPLCVFARHSEKAKEERQIFVAEQRAFFLKYGKIEYIKAPSPPPAPLPCVDVNMSDKELHEEMEKYFHRYDLDESGTLNSVEELQQLCTNLCFKLDLQLSGDEIDSVVNCAGELNDLNEWDVNEFCEWFGERFLGEDTSEQSFSAAMINNITMYQNMEMQDDILAAEEEAMKEEEITKIYDY